MKSLSWTQIRSWNGSQNKAFEELCCQLARHEGEAVFQSAEFQRRGTPDGGVECLWIVPDNQAWCWQAKYFTVSPGSTQWSEMDKSVETALDKNPNLSRYTICLPTLLPDARRKGRRSARQQWDDHVIKWNNWALEKGRSVEFILWDESQLLERLGKPEHAGRVEFWFGGPTFNIAWFSRVGVMPAIAQANARYSPPLHIEVPLRRTIESIQKSDKFRETLAEQAGSLRESMEDNLVGPLDEIRSETDLVLRDCAHKLAVDLSVWADSGIDNLPSILEPLSGFKSAVSNAESAFWESGEDLDRHRDFHAGNFWRLREKADEFTDFLQSPEFIAGLSGGLVITGEAGSGKTHLLCKSAETCIMQDSPAVLFLGEQFSDAADPWHQIQTLLGIQGARDEFLGALNAAGEAYDCRVSIMIDALNEGPGLRYWKSHLPAMLELAKHYPFLGIILSIRDLYAADLKKLITTNVSWAEHTGFRGQVSDAARKFFNHYGLAEPNVPVLSSEYENPLFLKLLCQVLRERVEIRLSDPPSFSSLLGMVLDDANERIAESIDYDPAEKYVHQAIAELSHMIAESESDWLPWPEVIKRLREIRPSNSRANCLAHHLLSEDLLTKTLLPGTSSDEEIVRFSYQKFSDYVVMRDSLQRELDQGGSGKATMTEALGRLGRSPMARSWLGAAAILSPELGGCELPDVIPNFREHPIAREAFLNSIQWRTRTAVTPRTEVHILTLLEGDEGIRREAVEMLLAVCTRTGHPLNAEWLDRYLKPLSMAERDSVWSTAIFNGWEEDGNVKRLIEWGWHENATEGLSEELVRLAATTLVWMFTTSDRFVRDRATKSAVAALENRLPLLCSILDHFEGVQEPYLQERLFAVTCGCALRSNQSHLATLAQKIYDRVFRAGRPPASVLVRDHARAVVEYALRRGERIDLNPKMLVPPYLSQPPADPPSDEDLKLLYRHDLYSDECRSLARIYHSVTGDDFSHYIVKDVMKWSNKLGGIKTKDSPRQLFEELKASKPPIIAAALEELDDRYSELSRYSLSESQKESDKIAIEGLEANLAEILGKRDLRLFLTKIKPFLLDRHHEKYRGYFSPKLFQRMILKRVLDLGWSLDLHGEFDENVPSGGRSSHKPERLGKKYQWIAYDELHARISDNYGLADENYSQIEDREWATGAWTSEYRDLDPTLLLRNSFAEGFSNNLKNWWTPHHYNGWRSESTSAEWIKSSGDFPCFTDFLKLTDRVGQSWNLLGGSYFWNCKVEDEEEFEVERDSQEFHLIYRSYLVKVGDLPKMLKWGSKQDWINDRLPSASSDYRAHLFEYYWSSRFAVPLDEEWIDRNWPDNDLPCPYLKTSAEYLCESSTYDCSVDSSVQIGIPERWLAEKLGIKPSGRNGDFVDSDGSVVTFDPSTREAGKSALLIHEGIFQDFLKREGLAVVWTLLGEKNYYPPSNSRIPFGRLTILGIYSSTGGEISGKFRTVFQDGHS